MCLGVPAKVIEIKDNGRRAVVDYGGIIREVDAFLMPDLKVGEYVIVHAGAIIEKLDEKEALESLKAWREVITILAGELERE
ncbi:MAG: HypC/HybG/HupF family hydrogenase formation chaperone [Thermoproteales archaeon]|nr:HypC/HybG/HupF family hydrogenase formation chaperone [Thermoproteales archaeon]